MQNSEASPSLSKMMSAAQDAECPGDDTYVCCAVIFILEPNFRGIQSISTLENELFMTEKSDSETADEADKKDIEIKGTKGNLDKNVAENSSLVIVHSNTLAFAFIVATVSLK